MTLLRGQANALAQRWAHVEPVGHIHCAAPSMECGRMRFRGPTLRRESRESYEARKVEQMREMTTKRVENIWKWAE